MLQGQGPLVVVLDPGHAFVGRGAALHTPNPASAGAQLEQRLKVALPHHAGPTQIRDTVQAWLPLDARAFRDAFVYLAVILLLLWRLRLLARLHEIYG